MEEHRDAASQARALFKHFLAERWFGGPDFDSWVKQHAECADELVRLRDEWFAELANGESSGALAFAQQGLRSAALEPGMLVGGFRLRERIGRGAMGEVWVAEELALGSRLVALKLLRPDLVPDPRALERFRREALAGARIHHPGVVAVYSAGRVQGQPYITQELVEGGKTLASIIAQAQRAGRPGSEHFRRAARLIAQAANALQAVHDNGIVHRDVKPQNILVTKEDMVKVADLGLAHLAGENVLSHTGDVMGTFCYMSPAQATGEVKELDGRADIFSLGATLYELLTLQRAFTGQTPAEITHRILHEDPPSARALHLNLPRDLERITFKALEKRAADRYASMAELEQDLGRFLRGEPILAKATSVSGRARKFARRHPSLSASLCVAALLMPGLTWLASLIAREKERTRQAEYEARLADAQWMSELGDMDRAAQLIEQSTPLEPSNPTGHLILATGFARLGRIPERDDELRRARALGFGETADELESALEHGAYGLYLMSQRDPRLYAQAEQHLRRALELEPARFGLHFSLYQMFIELGRVDEAVAELTSFRDRLPSGEPLFQVVDALRLEAEGDARAALAVLERVAALPGMDAERLRELRWCRHAGRMHLQLGELERAEEFLRRAVEEAPSDGGSWEGLAVVQLERLMRGDTSDRTRAMARQYAEQALAVSPALANPHVVRAWLAEWDLGHEPVREDPRQSASWQAARAALDQLAELHGAPEAARKLENELAALESWHAGRSAYVAEDYGRASEWFQELVRLDPEHLRGAALLGQCEWHTGRHEQGLESLQRALTLWDSPKRTQQVEESWLGAILAWMLGNADRAGDSQAFRRVSERLARELERGAHFQKEDLLTSAEFLALARSELRDCDLAWRIVDQQGLESAFDGTPGAAEAHRILGLIQDTCP